MTFSKLMRSEEESNALQPGTALTFRTKQEVDLEMDNVWLERTVRECGQVLNNKR
jgi:hypothetical protein